MKRILFVDDEPKILQGLERMLRGKRQEWAMTFAPGGEEALKELEKSAFEVIVSDMRMPRVDGATLLKTAQDRYPQVVRIVLSGYAEMETALRAVPVAHQFLAKPCEAQTLEDVINRACNLRDLLSDRLLIEALGKIDHLPVLPRIYQSLIKALSQPDMSIKEIAAIVEQDMAISAKVLQLVNSAFFSLPRRVTSVANAVSYLGLNMLKNLALSVEVFRAFQGRKEPPGFSFEELQKHAFQTASIAKAMFEDKQKAEDAFIAGMLHDIGKLILLAFLPTQFEQVLKETQEQGKPWEVVEKQKYGITHAEIGAYLLGMWGLPYPIIEAVAYHHEPRRVTQRQFDILTAVYAANLLAQPAGANFEDVVDSDYLTGLDVAGRIPLWKEMAHDIINHQNGGQGG